MGSLRKYFIMIFLVLLSVVGLCTAGTILEYKDEEKGIHHVQSGEPGVQVAGMFSFDAPEGESYNLAYTAGEQGFVANGGHLPAVPKDTEDVAAARSSFLEAFAHAEKMAAEVEPEVEMVDDNGVAEVVVGAVRRRRSPVTNPVSVSSGLPSNLPSYAYAYAHTKPVIDSSAVDSLPSYTYSFENSEPMSYSAPLTYFTYPTYSSYPTYAVQYPYYTYPSYTNVAVKSEEPMTEAENEEMVENSEVPVVQPALSLNHPVVRIGFQGLQPVHVAPVVVQPAESAE